jgi:predicted enzyme related to lactoylglutathione lyase
MPERDGYIEGVPCWVDTTQPDPEAAVDFYSRLFGWEFENAMPPGVPGSYYIARLRGGDVAAVGSVFPGAPEQAAWNTYIWVDDADATTAKAEAAGGTVLSEPVDVSDAGRSAVLADREGAPFSLWQPGRHLGARIVNEAGSINFNGLNTRDVAAAKEFYGAVFGWGTLALGDEQVWTLPAYGDHLAIDRPTIRQEMAEMGVAGFENVVAALVPLATDQPELAPHWSVTFGVEDADAFAETAFQLGATIIAPPFDAPWVRMTVIADPQGATLIGSCFTPENRDVGARERASANAA